MQAEGYESFLFATLNQLSKKFSEHKFLYIVDRPYDETHVFPENVQAILVGPKTNSSLSLQYWLNYKIPAALRKNKADVFLSLEGTCSLRTKTPQFLLISNLDFLQPNQILKNRQTRFYKKYTSAFLAKAKAIATVSEYSKKIITDQYKILPQDITVVHPIIDLIFKPLDWKDQELIKEKYADGKAYFLFVGNINRRSNFINLLKAFSFFKKRQKSNMMLLIAGNADESFKKEIKTYKYRDEVKLIEDLDTTELAKITASAYAMVYPVLKDEIALPALQALQCNVPIIISNTGVLTSVFGEAALYINPENFEDIAQKMMLVFKNEDKAKELIKEGNTLLQQYQLDKTTDLLMQCILKCAE